MMEWVELSAGVWMLGVTPFQSTQGGLNRLLFMVPLPVLGCLLTADALSRLGYI